MEYFQPHFERETPFEKRYLPYISTIPDANKRNEIANKLAGKVIEEDTSVKQQVEMKPHSGFIEKYNERFAKEKKMEVRKQSQKLYNEDGKRFGRNWDYESYKKIHDPLNIFEKEGNYEDLGYKVYNNVEDDNVFLKAMYYPKITSEDFHFLLDKFETEYSAHQSKNRFSYLLATGSVVGSWLLSYTFRFRPKAFLFTTLVAFISTKYFLNCLNWSKMQRNLNGVGMTVAAKYPEIKFSRVQYTHSSQLTPQKLH